MATAYALPYDLTEQHAIRRYGFHGIAHRAMWQRWRQLRPDLADGGRLITIQLGGGCSITATDNGLPQDTSMGFSPLEGLVMATRCGDIDPGIISYLMRQLGMSADDIDNVLNEKSGLMGLSGQSENIVDLIHNRDQRSRLAVDLYCYRVRKYLGAFQMILGGVDGIVFGGGVGEHVPEVREKVLNGMSWCGIELSKESNQQAIGREAQISHANSAVDVRVIPVDEASLLAQEAVAVLKQHII